MSEPTAQVPVSLLEQMQRYFRSGSDTLSRRMAAELTTLLSQPTPTAEPSEDDEGRIRRDERMRWAIYLWGMDEDTDGPEGAFEEGADMAYHAVAAWLLADIARGFRVSDMPWLDPDLITNAKAKARLLPSHPDSEVHEVDRCIAVLATIRDVTPPAVTA